MQTGSALETVLRVWDDLNSQSLRVTAGEVCVSVTAQKACGNANYLPNALRR